MRGTEISAVIGRSQLPRLDENIRRRTENLNIFLDNLDPSVYQTDFALEGCSNYAFTLILKKPDAVSYMWDSLAAAYLLEPEFVTKSEPRYLDVHTTWGQFYGSTVPLDRRVAPGATPVTVMLGLDFKHVFGLYKDRLSRLD